MLERNNFKYLVKNFWLSLGHKYKKLVLSAEVIFFFKILKNFLIFIKINTFLLGNVNLLLTYVMDMRYDN